jgi:tetratricopeptide (TPR) repeat protein
MKRPADEELRLGITEQARIVSELAEAIDPASVRKRAVAHWRLGRLHLRLAEYEEAADNYATALPVLWLSEATWSWAVNATGQRAVALLRLERYREALDELDKLVGRVGFSWAEEGETGLTADLVPIALGPWLWLMEQLGAFDEAYSRADDLISAYDPPRGQMQKLVLAGAFEIKGTVAQARGEHLEALALLGKAISHAEGSDDSGLRGVWADATLKLAMVLESCGRTDEARTAYERILAEAGAAIEPAIMATVQDARKRLSGLKAATKAGWRRWL